MHQSRGPGSRRQRRGLRGAPKVDKISFGRGWEMGSERHTEPGTGAATAERESIARGKKKDIMCFPREKRAKMVGEREEGTVGIRTNVQFKYSGARD